MRAAPLALAAALLVPIAAQAADAHSALEASRQRVQTADYRASGHIVRVQANGARKSYPITIKAHWFPGVLRVYVEISNAANSGPDSAVTAHTSRASFWRCGHGQEHYFDCAKRRQAGQPLPFDKWSEGLMGAAFSYEDFLEGQYFWAEQTAMGVKKFGSRDCDGLKSRPGETDQTHYAEVTSWLDHGNGFPVYVEKMLNNGAVKEFTSFGIRQEGGVWSAHQIEAKMRGQAGSTLLIFDRGTPKAHLSMKDFALEQLTHFQDGK